MSTWEPTEDFAEPFYGLVPMPDWLSIGGDQRAVYLYDSKGKQTVVPMQDSFEVAVSPPNNPGLVLDAEVGIYGPTHLVEYRRLFAKMDVTPNVGVRLGHFTHSYGLNLPDHTTPIRKNLGMGEGSETWNAEAYWLAPRGELIVTGILGSDLAVDLNSSHPGAYQTDSETGVAGRAAFYLGGSATAGLSFLSVSSFTDYREAFGTFLTAALGEGYILAEADRSFADGATSTLGMLKVGYPVARGVVGYVQGDTVDTAPDYRLGVQWLPVPHIEVTAEFRRTWVAALHAPRNSGVLLIHHWL